MTAPHIVLLILIFAVSGFAQSVSSTDVAVKAELAAKNRFIEQQNVALVEGNRLFQERSYTRAFKIYADIIKNYLAVVPDHPQLASIVIRASTAMRLAMTENYNVAVNAAAAAAKDPAVAKTRDLTKQNVLAGFKRSAELAGTAVKMAFDADINPKYKNASTGDQYLSALANQVEAVSMVAQYVEQAVSDNTHQSFLQYFSVEKDAVKRQKVWLKLGKLYLDIAEFDKANAVYSEILKATPDNTEALFNAGVAIISKGDEAAIGTAAGYLKRFLSLAPPTDPKRKDAQQMLDYIKSDGVPPK